MAFYQNDTDLNNKELMFTKEPFSCSLGSYNKIPYSYPSHWHEFMELIFVRKGYLRATFKNTSLTVNENELLVIMPGESHSFENDGDGLYENFVIKMDSVFIRNTVFDSLEVSKVYPYLFNLPGGGGGGTFLYNAEELKNSGILEVIKKFVTELQEKETGYTLSIRACLLDITAWLLRRWNNSSLPAQNTEYYSVYFKMQPVFNLINEQYQKNITTQEAADKINMSVHHFCRLFKKLTGYSFHNYIRKLRIDKAIKQLLTTSDSIKQISYAVGYNNESFFIRVFREDIGMSPEKYRKKYITSLL